MKLQGHQGAYGITREDVLAMRVGGKSRRDGRRVEGEPGRTRARHFVSSRWPTKSGSSLLVQEAGGINQLGLS
jgi:hypothetical protein